IIAHRHGHYASGKVLIQPGQQERRWSSQEPATAEQVVERAERQERRGWLPQAIETLQDGWKRFGEDQRIGLALGIARIKQGLFEQARDLLEPIVAQPTQPGDVDAARYYLALAIARLGNADAAERLWRQVNRGGDFWPAAQIELAQLAVSQARYRQAIEYVGPLLGGDRPHPQACVLACFALRKLGRLDEASRQVEAALAQDPLMLLAQTEQALLSGQPDLHGLSALRDEQRRIEAACWYLAVGEHRIAEELLRPPAGGSASPTALYLRALALERAGRNKEAARLRRRASRMNPRGHMPNRLEELEAFDRAVAANSDDPVAWYLRGLVLFSRNRRDQAVAAWKRAVQLRDDNAFAHRCLAAAIEADEPGAGLADLERAVQLEPSVAGLYADLDEAYQRAGILDKRITILEQAVARLPNRSGLAHRLGQAYFDAGQYGRAISCYRSHRFHVAEGRYELHDHYVMALMGRGLKRLGESDYDAALQDFSAALEYPENMSIGRPANPHGEAMIHYWRAVALSGLGRTGQARQALQQAARPEPLGRRLGPWAIGRLFSAVHQALACQRLGQSERLEQIL
ncbi:MAG: tetratricopeptide repeat protein, partial [Phycisphaerae bacterium]